MKKAQTRTEKDALGTVKVPKNAYFGSSTVRALKNFQISGITAPEIFQKALGTVKLAAAQSNSKLGLLDKIQAQAIDFIEVTYIHTYHVDNLSSV